MNRLKITLFKLDFLINIASSTLFENEINV